MVIGSFSLIRVLNKVSLLDQQPLKQCGVRIFFPLKLIPWCQFENVLHEKFEANKYSEKIVISLKQAGVISNFGFKHIGRLNYCN